MLYGCDKAYNIQTLADTMSVVSYSTPIIFLCKDLVLNFLYNQNFLHYNIFNLWYACIHIYIHTYVDM